jgi:hypothetical protein
MPLYASWTMALERGTASAVTCGTARTLDGAKEEFLRDCGYLC